MQVAAERAVLVAVHLPKSDFDPEDPFAELRALTETAGATIAGEMVQKRQKPSGKTYIGKGKTEELANLAQMTDATLIIFDNDLSPSQISAIEEATRCKVIDRSELILDIFANRATTHAAKLQVEIAQLEYTYPRLRAMWDHLGQVVGGAPVGIGTRGPGEQQIEIDRRIVQRRKRQLKRELTEIEDRRSREVESRNLSHYTVGLVGYTNAGKSTLFNKLTEGGAYADNRLFSTLATRIERWNLGGGNSVLLSDTVGFISNLPHHLVASFRSTLEETRHAQLLLIVLDVTDKRAESQFETVQETLDAIEADQQPRVLVLNKVDAIDEADHQQNITPLSEWLERYPDAIAISAAKGSGLDALGERVLEHMLGGVKELTIQLPMSASREISFLEKRAEVLEREYVDQDAIFKVKIGRLQIDQLLTGGVDITIDNRPALETVRELWGE